MLGQYYFSQGYELNKQGGQNKQTLARCPRDIKIENDKCVWTGSKENSDPFYQVYVQQLYPKDEELERYRKEGIR